MTDHNPNVVSADVSGAKLPDGVEHQIPQPVTRLDRAFAEEEDIHSDDSFARCEQLLDVFSQ